MLPVLSELQRMVSFSWAPGPCLIHTEMVKGSFKLVLTMPSGTLIAWVPLNSNTWSLSCPLSVGSPTVQLTELLGAGRSSTVPEVAPENIGPDRGNYNGQQNLSKRKLYFNNVLQSKNISIWTITDRKAYAVTSQNTCHGHSPSQYGWFPVQHWLGSMWLAHHRSLSAYWGKGPGYLCRAHIQSSYWSLKDEVKWRKAWWTCTSALCRVHGTS